jgi:peptidoglycan/LPS O-acetylase OafA/YrhL
MGTLVTLSTEAHTVRIPLVRADVPGQDPSEFSTGSGSGAHRRGPTRARLDSLTGLRFFAAGIVFFHHIFEMTSGTLREALMAVFAQGRAGVSFFFVLSGFVLAWSLRPGDPARSFWRRRFARVWPAYAVAAVIGYAVSRYLDGRSFSIEKLATDLAMLQSWVPAKPWYFSINPVGWSLSAEAFFYLTFPLYAAAILRMRGRSAAVLAGALLAGIFGLGAAIGDGIVVGGGYVLPDNLAIWLVYICPGTRIMEFLLGITLVVLIRRGVLPRVPVGLAWAALGLAWVLAGQVPVALAVVAVPVVPFCLLILAYAQRDVVAPRSTVWSSPTMVTLGNVSFCFYLIHQIVARVFTARVGHEWLAASTGVRSLKVIALVFVVSLAAAWLLHVIVEKPADRLLSGRSAQLKRHAGTPWEGAPGPRLPVPPRHATSQGHATASRQADATPSQRSKQFL